MRRDPLALAPTHSVFGLLHIRLALAALASFLTIALGSTAQAHVRWFTDPNDPNMASFPSYSFSDPEVMIWVAIAVVLVAIALVLDGRLPKVPVINTKIRHDVMELLRIFVGMSFLLTAYEGNLIAPHLGATTGFGYALVALQGLIGIMLISNHFLHHAAILMVILYLGVMSQVGFIMALEYINVIGIALFLLFNYLPSEELRAKYKPYSVDMLRIFTGIALITLGVTEKLSGALLGQSFMANYQWNFMPYFGFDWYTDQLFVLSAGVMEVVFGTIMVLGVITRLNTFVVASFMLMSNITFLLTDGQDEALTELIGHMPIIATAVILILLGYGQRLKISNLWLRDRSAPTAAVAAE